MSKLEFLVMSRGSPPTVDSPLAYILAYIKHDVFMNDPQDEKLRQLEFHRDTAARVLVETELGLELSSLYSPAIHTAMALLLEKELDLTA